MLHRLDTYPPVRKIAALIFAMVLSTAPFANAQTLLQRCLGIVPGQEPTGPLRPSPATMEYCQKLPGWDLYNQAGQQFQAGDHAAAAALLAQSSKAGNPIASLRLAMMYGTGDGVPHDLHQAFAYYRAAAEAGEPAAQHELAGYYEYGDGVVQDNWDEAAKWERASAQQGWVKGEFGLGRDYEDGIGVPLNLDQAIAWYDKAAAQGDGQAAHMAQYLRDNHAIDGSSRDPQEQRMLGPLVQRYVLTAPPIGMVFHNQAQHLAYIQNQANDEAQRKLQMEYNMQRSAYEACRNSGGSDCHPPVIRPPQ